MLANSRAKTNREPDGFVKVIADAKTDRVLGVWAIATLAGTMIAQAAQAMEFGATSEDIAYTCHAHPTHSPKRFKEAAMAVIGGQADPHLIPAWQVAMTDGTRFYVDALSGEVVARRTRWWRFYDWMWGLHIMDLKTREDTHNPLVIGFAIVALVTSILALMMLPMTVRRRRKRASE
jgi:hypothetical protein